jgi:hypothetical protein
VFFRLCTIQKIFVHTVSFTVFSPLFSLRLTSFFCPHETLKNVNFQELENNQFWKKFGVFKTKSTDVTSSSGRSKIPKKNRHPLEGPNFPKRKSETPLFSHVSVGIEFWFFSNSKSSKWNVSSDSSDWMHIFFPLFNYFQTQLLRGWCRVKQREQYYKNLKTEYTRDITTFCISFPDCEESPGGVKKCRGDGVEWGVISRQGSNKKQRAP